MKYPINPYCHSDGHMVAWYFNERRGAYTAVCIRCCERGIPALVINGDRDDAKTRAVQHLNQRKPDAVEVCSW